MMETEQESDNAIQIRGLQKHFPKFDLGPIDLNVPRGSIYGLVGPNGAGKSTTIDLMFGMGVADGGTIEILGLDARTEEVAVKLRAAYVAPELDFGAWGKINHAIRFVRGFYPQTWDDDYCAELLARFGLDPLAKVRTLSFGSKTKLSLVLALSHRPEVLVLDEPTTGLDAIAKQELFSQLLELVEDAGHTILISSHSLADVERIADQLGIIHEGCMIHEGPTHEIVDRYSLVDIAEYLIAENQSSHPGLRVVRREKDRLRILVDREAGGDAFLKDRNIPTLGESPLTLEDLFVALLQKRERTNTES